MVVANPRVTCPAFIGPFRSPPAQVHLYLRMPLEVSASSPWESWLSPALAQLRPQFCFLCCLCAACLTTLNEPTPQAIFFGQLKLLPWTWLWLCT